MLFMVVPGTKLGPLNGPNCIPADPPVETAWGTFDGEPCHRGIPAVWLLLLQLVSRLLLPTSPPAAQSEQQPGFHLRTA